MMDSNKVFSGSFCCLLAANFFLYFAFYLILPVLPLYLLDVYAIPNSQIGIILSCYTLSALLVRPFSGYLLDTLARKPLYLLTFLIFILLFYGYIVASTIAMLITIRSLHGLAFGVVTVSGNTIAIDILPSERRGEGLGYYGLSNNIAMCFGPMTGLFLKQNFSYDLLFLTAFGFGIIGFVLALLVKSPVKPIKRHEPISMDRFLLLKGVPAGIALLFLSIPYGMTSTYLAIFSTNSGIPINPGFFFSCMAIGMMIARLFSGKLVDRGLIPQVITVGILVVTISYFILSFLGAITTWSILIGIIVFLVLAFFLGAGFGTMFPAFNTLFVNLGRNDQRGTATSTYLTAWDIGIGGGLLLGGYISEISTFAVAYRIGSVLCLLSLLLFIFWVTPHFQKNKLR